ncbi:MAG: 2-amino-4-hydroxy-6-hydroxymethyldihydropteridine diphosphokinase [Candidatus Peregrinibacteria bacterium]
MKKVYLGLGTNLGNRKQNLDSAIKEISNFAKVTNKSSIHETEPVGYKPQPKFLNQVIELETDLPPTDLLIRLHEIEHSFGRNRDNEIKNGPRIIDLDILLYKNQTIDLPNLKIPHPRMHEREFVQKPLKEILK